MTFDFVIDAFPVFTNFDKTKKVQFVLQVIDTATMGTHDYSDTTINEHTAGEAWDTSMSSATASIYTEPVIYPGTTYSYAAVQNPTGNPKAQGWYERSGTSPNYVYTPTTDTAVNESKTYYARVQG